MSRQVYCEIEGRRSEPLRGVRGMLPRKHLKLKSPRSAFSCNLVKKSSRNDAYLTSIIVKNNGTLREFVYFTTQL